MLGEGIELFKGNIPRWSDKKAAFQRGNAALGREYYIQIRDIIIALFYWSPNTYLTIDRCFQYIRVKTNQNYIFFIIF